MERLHTDVGYCYTFNHLPQNAISTDAAGDFFVLQRKPQNHFISWRDLTVSARLVLRPGPRGGLAFVLNAEQYDYTRGVPDLFASAGFTLRVHDQTESIVHMSESAIMIPVGFETNIALSKEEVNSLASDLRGFFCFDLTGFCQKTAHN